MIFWKVSPSLTPPLSAFSRFNWSVRATLGGASKVTFRTMIKQFKRFHNARGAGPHYWPIKSDNEQRINCYRCGERWVIGNCGDELSDNEKVPSRRHTCDVCSFANLAVGLFCLTSTFNLERSSPANFSSLISDGCVSCELFFASRHESLSQKKTFFLFDGLSDANKSSIKTKFLLFCWPRRLCLRLKVATAGSHQIFMAKKAHDEEIKLRILPVDVIILNNPPLLSPLRSPLHDRIQCWLTWIMNLIIVDKERKEEEKRKKINAQGKAIVLACRLAL